MLKIQQVKTVEKQHSQTRKVSIFDDSFELNAIISYELYSWYYRLIIKWERNKKKLWPDWISELKYDKKIYQMNTFEINKKLIIKNYYLNEKNSKVYYTINDFLDKLVEELKTFEENN